LQHVFGVGVVAHDAAREAVEPSIVLLDDEPDRLAILLPRALEEPIIVAVSARAGAGILILRRSAMPELDANRAKRFPDSFSQWRSAADKRP
jgi:hypothetical protein